jgi:hypothetical protein
LFVEFSALQLGRVQVVIVQKIVPSGRHISLFVFCLSQSFSVILGGMVEYAGLVEWAHLVSQYSFQNQFLEPVVRAFMENVDRCRCLILAPAVIAAHAEANARSEEIGPEHLQKGARAVEHYHWSIPAVTDGMQSLFSSVLIGAWTAFEALATDLWIKAVNQRPMSLGLKAIKAPRRQQSEAETEAEPKQKPQTVKVDMLAKYEFDLKDRLGYILWRERQFDFNTLAAIRYAYKVVFGKDGESWFSGDLYEKYLPTLEALRHVLVHRAGRIDQFFLDRVKHIPSYAMLSKDSKLHIEADSVKGNCELAFTSGLHLLDNVDQWLQGHPD